MKFTQEKEEKRKKQRMDEIHGKKTQDDRLKPKHIYNPIKCQLSKNHEKKRDCHTLKKQTKKTNCKS